MKLFVVVLIVLSQLLFSQVLVSSVSRVVKPLKIKKYIPMKKGFKHLRFFETLCDNKDILIQISDAKVDGLLYLNKEKKTLLCVRNLR